MAALEYGASIHDILVYEMGLSEEETQEILQELYGDNDN